MSTYEVTVASLLRTYNESDSSSFSINASVNQVCRDGNTPLMEAVNRNVLQDVELMIRCGANVNYCNLNTNQRAIDLAWDNEFYDSFLKLLEAGADFPTDNFHEGLKFLDVKGENEKKIIEFVDKRNALHKYITENDTENVKRYVTSSKSLKCENSEGKLALETAAANDNARMIAILLRVEYSDDRIVLPENKSRLLNQVNKDGNTPLLISANSGLKDNVSMFIRCGADVNRRNNEGKSAVDLAWEHKQYAIVLILLESDSDFPRGFTLEQLESDRAGPLIALVEKRNELHELIRKGEINEVRLHLSEVSSRLYLNSKGESAVYTAKKENQFRIFVYLRVFGFKIKYSEEDKRFFAFVGGERSAETVNYMFNQQLIDDFSEIED